MQALWLGVAASVAMFASTALAGQSAVTQTSRVNVFGAVQVGGLPTDVTQSGKANVAGVVVYSVAPSVNIRQSGTFNSAVIGTATPARHFWTPGAMP